MDHRPGRTGRLVDQCGGVNVDVANLARVGGAQLGYYGIFDHFGVLLECGLFRHGVLTDGLVELRERDVDRDGVLLAVAQRSPHALPVALE